MNTLTKSQGNIRQKSKLINKPKTKNNVLASSKNLGENDNLKNINDKNKEDKNILKRMYKQKVIAVEIFNYFKEKEKENSGEVFITQNEIMDNFIKQGWSRSHIYQKLKKFSEGIVRRKFNSDKVDIFEPLLLEISRLEIDNKSGVCYKLNNCWKEVAVGDIAKTFYGK